jgi:hypothetical protein
LFLPLPSIKKSSTSSSRWRLHCTLLANQAGNQPPAFLYQLDPGSFCEEKDGKQQHGDWLSFSLLRAQRPGAVVGAAIACIVGVAVDSWVWVWALVPLICLAGGIRTLILKNAPYKALLVSARLSWQTIAKKRFQVYGFCVCQKLIQSQARAASKQLHVMKLPC